VCRAVKRSSKPVNVSPLTQTSKPKAICWDPVKSKGVPQKCNRITATCMGASKLVIRIPTENSGSYLVELPCKSVKKEQQWKRKDLHICSNQNGKCFTVSSNSKDGGVFLNLMTYEASAKSQQWRIGSTQSGHKMIMNVGTSLCLLDPLEDHTRKVSATASTTVQSC